jgi:hypothetical protein
MKWLETVWEEIIGLFVDDVSFAVAIVVWLGASYLLFHAALVPAPYRGPVLFAGLAIIFIENTLRRARK